MEVNKMMKEQETKILTELYKGYIYFTVAPCISNIKHFIAQLMHTNYKNP